MAESELHLFIIWEKARDKERQIIDNIKENFKILEIRYITWPRITFSNNLTRFYGQNLPSSSKKIEECGVGEFVLVIVSDECPKYKPRYTSKGCKIVNVNLFDAKEMYRYWTGGGSRVHATNSTQEVSHDLTLMIGMNAEDYVKMRQIRGDINATIVTKSEDELLGAHGWKDINELFYALNNCTEYVVLRNYEEMPEKLTLGKHGDVDFLCDNLIQMELVTNSNPVAKQKFRVRRAIRVGNDELYCDFRHYADNYYDIKWEKNILATRTKTKDLFYTPNDYNMFYSLLYHALIQKYTIAEDYLDKLKKYGNAIGIRFDQDRESMISLLLRYMEENGYSIVEPDDLSVNFNVKGTNTHESKKHLFLQKKYRLLKRIVR